MEFVNNLEECLGLKAKKEFLPMQAGDVKYTFADTSFLEKLINYKPNTEISYGIGEFIKWYKVIIWFLKDNYLMKKIFYYRQFAKA